AATGSAGETLGAPAAVSLAATVSAGVAAVVVPIASTPSAMANPTPRLSTMASGRIHRRRGAAAGAGVGLATASGSSSGRSVSTGTSTISGSSRHRRGLGGEQALAVVLLLREGRGHVRGHVLGGARLARARDVS